ncbi:MAG: Hint domain-containing protein [Rhodobacteraceae bacterium]|nr:Hint domain-containing protein [Paracoccaceae bacterium]
MSWLALRTEDGAAKKVGGAPLPEKLGRGTLVMDIDLGAFAKARTPLLRLQRRLEPRRVFVIEPYSDGRLHLLRRHGPEVSHLSVGLGREPISGRLRLSYHWDCARGRSLLTAENLTRGTLRQQETGIALPMERAEIAALIASANDCERHPLLGWIGLADHWQTIGPMPGLAPDTLIETTTGNRPIRDLRPGDRVITADGAPGRVLWQGKVSVPSLGTYRPVRLCAPYFGLSRDLIVQPSQRIVLSGADIEYHFGEEEVIAEARHLVHGVSAVREPAAEIVSSHGILLEQHALIRAEGIWTESLYMGRIARNRELARSTAPGALVSDGQLPVHDRAVRRELLEYEARALGQIRQRHNSPLAA